MDMTLSRKKRSKNKQAGQHQTKELLHRRKKNHKIKMQSTEWEKISADHIPDKGVNKKNTKGTHIIQQQKNK